jgi:protein AFG1
MEGKKDYRKLEIEEQSQDAGKTHMPFSEPRSTTTSGISETSTSIREEERNASDDTMPSSGPALPRNYLIQPSTAEELTSFAESFNILVERATSSSYPIPWEPSTMTVYGRPISIPAQFGGVAFFTFEELCGAALGPADYITLASTYHTFILTDVPIMQFLQKNEARRLITLLDALYEARCRLLVTAVAGPDDIFFPEPPTSAAGSTSEDTLLDDAVYPETYSEIYQDATSPFRPNVSSYSSDVLAADALEDDPPNRARTPGSSYTDERRLSDGSKVPDFANIGGLTGEDERFAVKRAESRIWEMCSMRWWDRATSSSAQNTPSSTPEPHVSWWRPLPLSSRHWERPSIAQSIPNATALPPNVKILSKDEQQGQLFPHGASPFRTHPDAPPKIDWTHVWGTVKWGKKAGPWGKGVEGLEDRKSEKNADGTANGDGDGGKSK